MFGWTRRAPDTRLVGPGVYLRAPRRSDQEAWLEVRRVSRDFLEPWEPSWPPDALSPTGFRQRLNRYLTDWDAGVGYAFFIFRNTDDALLGGITLANVRRGVVQSANLGYWTGLPYVRNGHMAEAVQIVLHFCFATLELHRVEAATLPENLASRGLLERSGFRQEGLARQYLCIAGRWQDHVTFGILKDDTRPALPVLEVE